MRYFVLLPIWFYRLLISPLLPPSCRYVPSCSEYAADAVKRHGAWYGGWLTLKRLASCHPIKALGCGQGFDPVPLEILRPAWYMPWKVKGDAHD